MSENEVTLDPRYTSKCNAQLDEIEREMAMLRTKVSGFESRKARFLEICEQIRDMHRDTEPQTFRKASIRGSNMICFICALEIPSTSMKEHSTKCINTLLDEESHMGSERSRISDLFCDAVYKDGTFCKRLKIRCPTHGGKSSGEEFGRVCGYPSNLAKLYASKDDPIMNCCQYEKSGCMHHYGWQQRELNWLDFERLTCWMKLDKLGKKQSLILRSMDLAKHPLNSYGLTIERQE